MLRYRIDNEDQPLSLVFCSDDVPVWPWRIDNEGHPLFVVFCSDVPVCVKFRVCFPHVRHTSPCSATIQPLVTFGWTVRPVPSWPDAWWGWFYHDEVDSTMLILPWWIFPRLIPRLIHIATVGYWKKSRAELTAANVNAWMEFHGCWKSLKIQQGQLNPSWNLQKASCMQFIPNMVVGRYPVPELFTFHKWPNQSNCWDVQLVICWLVNIDPTRHISQQPALGMVPSQIATARWGLGEGIQNRSELNTGWWVNGGGQSWCSWWF